ncbi:MAG: DUF882 domain-containing protein [Nitrospirae bacterium]|nr:MAG: DUF882 domain-containing protein [Nitrospirota bacterium]
MAPHAWTRRSLLKASLAGLLVLLGKTTSPAEMIPVRLPEGRLVLYNLHTDERATVTYRSPSGEYDRQALHDLNHILRCHYSNQMATMDLRVIEYLNAVDKRLGGNNEIHIVSGYRSPEYNDLLIRQGKAVAKNSLHVLGQAVDIQMPGVDLTLVRQAALSLEYGGVGYYPASGFLHLDSGRFRWW